MPTLASLLQLATMQRDFPSTSKTSGKEFWISTMAVAAIELGTEFRFEGPLVGWW